MTDIWVAADHHFRHRNILRSTDKNGNLIRGSVFKDIDHHDNQIIDWHNELVKPQDHVYLLGDLCINKGGFEYVKRLNGHLRLVRGNHDIFEDKLYYEAGIEKIFGVRVFQNHNPPYIFSHIPIHPDSLKHRDNVPWINVHGHLHQGYIGWPNKPDERYMCVSLEHTNYKPLLLMR